MEKREPGAEPATWDRGLDLDLGVSTKALGSGAQPDYDTPPGL